MSDRATVLRHLVSRFREGDHVDPLTGEANLTEAAEAIATDLDHDEWLDDPDHYVWECAIEASELAGVGVRL